MKACESEVKAKVRLRVDTSLSKEKGENTLATYSSTFDLA